MTGAPADACPLCDRRDTTALLAPVGQPGFRIVRCGGCGLARTEPQPSDEALRRSYSGDYATRSGRKFGELVERTREALARRLARHITRRARLGAALDVGCGDGKLTLALRDEGFTTMGTELNPRAARADLAARGIEVRVGALEDLRLAPASFQVVVLRHVLEHLRDPASTLREIRRVLHPEGLLLIEVPNLASWQARAAGAHWFHLDVPRHLFHFTDETLAALLARTGFRVESTHHFSLEQAPFGWLQSIFNRLGSPWADLYDRLRAAKGTERAPVPIGVVAAAAALVPMCTLLSVAESLARRGGAVQVWARPLTPS